MGRGSSLMLNRSLTFTRAYRHADLCLSGSEAWLSRCRDLCTGCGKGCSCLLAAYLDVQLCCVQLKVKPKACKQAQFDCILVTCSQAGSKEGSAPRSNQGLLPPSMSWASLLLICCSAGLHSAEAQRGKQRD